jgi:hypothetical protein
LQPDDLKVVTNVWHPAIGVDRNEAAALAGLLLGAGAARESGTVQHTQLRRRALRAVAHALCNTQAVALKWQLVHLKTVAR